MRKKARKNLFKLTTLHIRETNCSLIILQFRTARATLLIGFCRTLKWKRGFLRNRLRKLLVKLGLVSLFSYLGGVSAYIYDWIRMRRRRMEEEQKKRSKINKMMRKLRKPKKK